MPANKKYLTASGWERFGKISAAIVGGYAVTVTLHLALASWFSRADVMITMAYSGFILWVLLMVLAFLARKAWKIWALYILITLIFAALTYIRQNNIPLI